MWQNILFWESYILGAITQILCELIIVIILCVLAYVGVCDVASIIYITISLVETSLQRAMHGICIGPDSQIPM